jgi:hypothetical protein
MSSGIYMNSTTVSVDKESIREENGVYTMIVGGLNIWSHNGFYYIYSDVSSALFNPGTPLMNSVNGGLEGEHNHPSYIPGTPVEQMMRRHCSVDKTNVSHTILDISIKDSGINEDKLGRRLYLIVVKLRPSGPKGALLKASLDDPNEDTAFSVRSFSNKYTESGIAIKEQKEIITWDWVERPGHPVAKKSATLQLLKNSMDEESTFIDAEAVRAVLSHGNEIMETMDSEADGDRFKRVLNVLEECVHGNNCIYTEWA